MFHRGERCAVWDFLSRPVGIAVEDRIDTPPDVPAPDSSAPTQPKRRPGAPAGNVNAGKHLAYSKRRARDQRDRHKRKAETEALDILRSCGLQEDPLAALVARNLRRLETQAGRFEAFLDSRGSFTRSGDVKPAVREYAGMVERLLGEARRLLDQLREVRDGGMPATLLEARQRVAAIVGRWPASVEFRIASADGTPFDLGDGLHPPASPLQADPDGAVPPPPAESNAAPRPAARPTSPHPLDVLASQSVPAPAADTRTANERHRDAMRRAWATGSDIDD
jgi:hypothetical protein